MKLLLDMNLSPQWIDYLEEFGWEAIHWSSIGDPRAPDRDIINWAHQNDYVVFTHDLDFAALLVHTQALGPSVIQLRTQDVMPNRLGPKLVKILRKYGTVLEKGALVTVDEHKSRLRILPFNVD